MRPFPKEWRNIATIVTKNWLASLLILTAAFLRLYRFREFVTFLGDQGRDAIIIRRILNLEHFPAIGAPTSIGQIYLGPFYYYLMSPFLLLSRFDPLGLAIGVAMLTLVGLIASYFVVKKEAGVTVALFFLAIATFSFSNIELARFSWNPNLLPIFAFFTLYFFYRTLKDKTFVWAAAFGAFFSFSIQLHYLALFLLPSMVILAVYDFLKDKHFAKLLKNLAISIASFIIFSSPLIIFDLRHNFLNSKNFWKLLTQEHVVASASYLTRLIATSHALVQHTFQVSVQPALAAIMVVAIFSVAGWLIYRQKKAILFALLMLLSSVFYVLLFSLLDSPKIPHYFGSAYYSFFFVVAYLLGTLFAYKSVFPKAIAVVLLLLYVLSNARQYYYFANSPNNQIEAAQKIATDVRKNVSKTPYQVISLPTDGTGAHVRYFLELWGARPLEENSTVQPAQLFVLCFDKECDVLSSGQWQIAFFTNKKVDTIVKSGTVTIYRIVHEK